MIRKAEGKISFRCRRTWEYNPTMCHKQGVDWTEVAQNAGSCKHMNSIYEFSNSRKALTFLNQLRDCQLLKQGSVLWRFQELNKTTKNLSHNSRCPGKGLNLESAEYE
jgi:hypothetical protein